MKITDLRRILQELDIPESEYNLHGELQENSVILIRNYNLWQVISYERGERNEMGSFYTEDEACEYVYEFFLKSVQSWKEFGLKY